MIAYTIAMAQSPLRGRQSFDGETFQQDDSFVGSFYASAIEEGTSRILDFSAETFQEDISFEQIYTCFSIFGESNRETEGNKIIMPESALDRLMSIPNIEYPMMFEIQNPSSGKTSHCGVLEFTSSSDGVVFIPNWMMQNLKLQEGSDVKLMNARLPKGSFIKLQPHTSDFLGIPNPKQLLEATLKNFSCLTNGDTILITREGKSFYIDIVEIKPSSAVSIVDTDCEVDFAPPLDYKEPKKQKPISSAPKDNLSKEDQEPRFKPFTGGARRLDAEPLTELGKILVPKVDQLIAANGLSRGAQTSSDASLKEEQGKPKFKPFTGGARRLDGQPVAELAAVTVHRDGQSVAVNGLSRVTQSNIGSSQNAPAEEEKEATFKPFTGGARRLDEQPATEFPSLPVLKKEKLIAANGLRSTQSNFGLSSNNEPAKEEEPKFKQFTARVKPGAELASIPAGMIAANGLTCVPTHAPAKKEQIPKSNPELASVPEDQLITTNGISKTTQSKVGSHKRPIEFVIGSDLVLPPEKLAKTSRDFSKFKTELASVPVLKKDQLIAANELSGTTQSKFGSHKRPMESLDSDLLLPPQKLTKISTEFTKLNL